MAVLIEERVSLNSVKMDFPIQMSIICFKVSHVAFSITLISKRICVFTQIN